MTNRMKAYNNILDDEKQLLDRSAAILQDYDNEKSPLYKEYKILFQRYKKLLKQIQYLFKISDTYQKNLMKTKEKLQKEIGEKNKTEKNLKEKIDELQKTREKLETTNEKLKKISTRDQLTELFNRREFERIIKKEWRNAIRERNPISLIMIDIDHFKNFNDNYGHLAGDNCLQKLSKKLQSTLQRPRDFLARYGGEEFVVILPNTDKDGALHIAKDIRKNVEELNIPHEFSPIANHVTVSIGVSSTDEPELYLFEEVLDKADQALYEAKESGRNKYCFISIEY